MKDGVVKEKAYDYVCLICKWNVASNVKTGRIDHRTVCGSQLSVTDGVVKALFTSVHIAKAMWKATSRQGSFMLRTA